jgi:tetratricopeptide (TPR) repeat protein
MRVHLLAALLAAMLAVCPAKLLAGQPPRGSEGDELKLEPKQNRPLFESALRLEREGKTAAAIAAYGELLRKAPNDWYGLRHRGQLLLKAGQLEAASHDLSAVLLAHPEDGAAWASYGDCMRGLKRDKDAVGSYSKAIENGFNNSAVNRSRGDVLASSGDNDAALESYSTAIKLRLDNPETYFTRGMLLMKMKRARDAVDDFTRAIDFNPDYADAYFNRGKAWGELSQFANAVRDLDVFLRRKPGDAQALGYRGAALDSIGRVEEALADYAGALKAEPANPRILMARAALYSRLGRYADALADLDRAIALDPPNAYFWLARGGTQLALGNAERAIGDRTRAVELAPANALMWYSRAATYSALEQPDKALDDAIEALRRDPGFEPARKLIDEIQASSGWKAAAVPQPPTPQRPKLQPGLQPGAPAIGPSPSSEAIPQPVQIQPIEASPQAEPRSGPAVGSSRVIAVTASAATSHGEAIVGAAPTPAPPPLPTASRAIPVTTPRVAERPATASGDSSQQLYKDGRALLQRDQFAAASAKFTQASALDPGNPQVWNALGYCHLRQENYKEALAAFDKAIALNPRYQNAFENRSAVKRLLGDDSGSARDRIQAQLLAKHQ